MAKKQKEKMIPEQIIARFNHLKGERGTWENHWTDLGNYVLPNRSDVTTSLTPGQKRVPWLLDNTAMMSNELLAGAMHGMLTSPSAPWFELTTGDNELDNLDGVRMWLQKVTDRMHTVINNSNFQTEVHPYYLDLTCFGTGTMFIEEDEISVVRFSTKHIKEIFVSEDNQGKINEVYRKFQWDIRQIVGEFGMDVLKKSSKLMDMWKENSNINLTIIHAIYPQDVSDHGDNKEKFCSHYILEDAENGLELEYGYYRQLPGVIARWTKAAGEVYGRSPGMNALPDAKTLNKMTETILIAAQKATDPPLQAPDDTFVLPIRTRPGGISYYRSGTQDRITPIFNNANIDFGFEAMKERAQRVRQAFYVDQLQLSQGPQMTATEVLQRTEEKMRLLGPMLGRQQAEFLRPMIERVFDIMTRRGLVPIDKDVLQILDSRGIHKLDVSYSSMIAKAQKVQDGQDIQRTMQAIAPFAATDQSVLDNFDGDKAVRSIAKIFGFPQEILRDQKAIDSIRQKRAEAQAKALKMQQDQHQADLANKVLPGAAKLAAVQNQAQQVSNG